MKLGRFLLTYVFIISSLAPYSAQALWGNGARPDTSKVKFTKENYQFIAEYKAYVNALLHVQAAEAKKKIICLGYPEMADLKFNLLKLTNDPELEADIKGLILNYKNTEECENFLKTKVPEVTREFKKLKVYLALHRAGEDEFRRRFQDARAGFTHINSELPEDWFRCNFRTILVYDYTKFCFKNISSMFNPVPRHITRKISIDFLDNMFGEEDIPEIIELSPLTWKEVQVATGIIKEKLVTSEASLSEQIGMTVDKNFSEVSEEKRWDEPNHPDRWLESYGKYWRQNQIFIKKYEAISEFQARGLYVFSDYPEESAPRKYAEILTRNPVLGFFEPDMEEVDLDCETVSLNMSEICNKYVDFLERESQPVRGYVQTKESVYKNLAQAYQKVLLLNQLLIKSLNIEYNSEDIFRDDLTTVDNISPDKFEGWEKLVKLELALESFLEMNPKHKGFEEKHVNQVKRKDMVIAILSIGGVVGLGVACGFIGNFLGATACVLAAGLGANLMFYRHSLKDHAETMKQFFSNPGEAASEGMDLTLIEFEKMKGSAQFLAVDAYMVGIGTGIGHTIGKLRKLIKVLKAAK